MPSWRDLAGTINNVLQIGLGTGAKTLKFGDFGSLSWSPSVARAIAFPDKDGTIALTSDTPAIDGRIVSWGATKPASPVDGQLWFEPLGYDVPWEWNASTSLWLSPVRYLALPLSVALISSQPSNRIDHPLALPTTAYGIYIRNVLRTGSPGASGTDSSNCWNAAFGWWNGTSNTLVQLNSYTTATFTTAGSVYRGNTAVNTNYTNPYGLWCSYTKTGTPVATTLGISVDYRISRT
jgi:hypothetical protein